MDLLFQFISLGNLSKESTVSDVNDKCLAVGSVVIKNYQDYKRSLEIKKLSLRNELQLERMRLCQAAREHRQRLWQIQLLKYKEEASFVNRKMLLELLQETSILRQKNVRLKAELQLMECKLESMKFNNVTNNEIKHDLIKQDADKDKGGLIHSQACELDSMKQYCEKCVLAESMNSTWRTASDVSSCIPPVPD
eukprot:g5915.t1